MHHCGKPNDDGSNKDLLLLPIAAGAGVLTWLAITAISGESEAWDSHLYFAAGIPALMIVSAILGWFAPRAPWRWGLATMMLQPLALAFTGDPGGMFPLGLLFFAAFSIPCMLAAYGGARLRRIARSGR